MGTVLVLQNEAQTNRPRSVKKVIFYFSGHRIRYLYKYGPFLDFQGHRIRYLLNFNENILFLYE
jgi:hypothetical protein